MKKAVLGVVGAGWASRLHCNALRQVGGYDVTLKSVIDVNGEAAAKLAGEYGFSGSGTDMGALLDDDEIDAIVLCTPPRFHTEQAIAVLNAGKNVICEKPLTGYFGFPDDPPAIGQTVAKRKMFAHVLSELDRLEAALRNSGKVFCYAENYIYSPNLQKAAELIGKKGSTILYMRGEESVRGSISAFGNTWANIGGGSLMRIGCHPLGGILYLKQREAAARGCEIRPVSVVADTGRLLDSLAPGDQRRYIRETLLDVEDFATLTVTFSDGTKATVFANDNVLGGVENYVDIFCNDGVLKARITPTDDLSVYFADDAGLENAAISENHPFKTGWNRAFVSEMVHRGYVDQLSDFLGCVTEGREPQSGFSQARQVCELIYAAYVSAEEGRRVQLSELLNNGRPAPAVMK